MAYSVVINSCSLLLLSTLLPPEVRQDTLDTVLFAQLAAEEDFPHARDHAQWSGVFMDTLAACGWKFHDQGATSGMFPSSGVRSFTLSEAVHAAFQSGLSAQQVTLPATALRRVAQLPEQSPGARVFRERSIMGCGSQSGGMDASFNGMHRLRVLVGIAESDGFLTLATVFFETDQPIESQFIRQDFALSSVMGGVKTAFFHARFSVDEYKAFRDDTVQWLGPQRLALCINVGEHDVPLTGVGFAPPANG